MKIEKLPALTQARILTELQADPEQIKNVKAIMKSKNPAAEMVLEQEKVAMNVVKPGTFPEVAGKWPVFRRKFQMAYKEAVRRYGHAGRGWGRGKGMQGLGEMGQWQMLLQEAMGMVKQYGVPALKKNLEIQAQKKKEKKAGKLAAKAADQLDKATVKKEIEQAQQEQQTIEHQVAPETHPKPKVSKKTLAIGGGAAAVAVLGIGAILLMGRRKKNPRRRRNPTFTYTLPPVLANPRRRRRRSR